MRGTSCLRKIASNAAAGSSSSEGVFRSGRRVGAEARHWPSTHDLPRKSNMPDQPSWCRAPSPLIPRIDGESKTIATPGGALPISPLMDEDYLKAWRKHDNLKPKPDKAKAGKLERQLEKNPYAMALATNVRHDGVTNTTLPRYFLQDFYFIENPETKALWFTPGSLMDGHNPDREGQRPMAQDNAPLDDDACWDAGGAELPTTRSHDTAVSPAEGSCEPPRPRTARAYTLPRRELLALLPGGQGLPKEYRKYRNAHHRMSHFAKQPHAVYRADMDEFVLELMRADIVKSLLYLARLCEDVEDGRKYIVRCSAQTLEEEDWGSHVFRGCVLWLGYRDDIKDTPPPPKEFEVVTVPDVKRNAALPVHDLNRLLGTEAVKKLRAERSTFRQGVFFLLARERTSKLQMALWKLQGYLAEYPEYR